MGLLDHYRIIRRALYKSLSAAEELGDSNSLALLAGRLHENFRDCGRLTGELQRGRDARLAGDNGRANHAPLRRTLTGLGQAPHRTASMRWCGVDRALGRADAELSIFEVTRQRAEELQRARQPPPSQREYAVGCVERQRQQEQARQE